MSPQIRNIIFDWGGVLIDLDTEGCIEAFRRLGADVKALLTGTNELGIFSAYESGALDTAGFRQEIRRIIGKEVSDEEIDKAWNTQLKSIPSEKLELLLSLKPRYNLYLLSNTNELHWLCGAKAFDYKGHKVEDYFKQIFLSYRMHLAKPNPQIFVTALREAGLKAGETLFIDDAPANCRAASSVGLHVCHYVPSDDLGKAFL